MDDNVVRLYSKVIGADGTERETERELLSEHEMTVAVNETKVFSLVCTREYLKEL